jgi:hypothetical protein
VALLSVGEPFNSTTPPLDLPSSLRHFTRPVPIAVPTFTLSKET